MRIIYDNEIENFNIFVVISNKGKIVKCFGNEENAYSFATRECFKYIEENYDNKYLFKRIYDADDDYDSTYKTKLEIIHENYELLVRTDLDYHELLRVEEYELDTNDIYE